MRRTLGPLLLSLFLAAGPLTACGDDGGQTATDTSTPDHTVSGDATTVALVSRSAAGGRVSTEPVVLDDEQAVASFTEQFRTREARQRITRAVARADVPDGQTLVGAVVAVGCDVPPSVSVHAQDGGLTIAADPVPSPQQECLVAVTTVALVAVDSNAV
jgi:hypothetical protein